MRFIVAIVVTLLVSEHGVYAQEPDADRCKTQPDAEGCAAQQRNIAGEQHLGNSMGDTSPRARDPMDRRGLTLFAELGIATPYGAIGLAVEALRIRWFALEAGVGTNGNGVELAASARGRIPMIKHLDDHVVKNAIDLGVGVSGGRYLADGDANGIAAFGRVMESIGDSNHELTDWDRVYWLNTELGMELLPPRSRVVFRPYIGFAQMVASSAYHCREVPDPVPCNPNRGHQLVYVGIGIGFLGREE